MCISSLCPHVWPRHSSCTASVTFFHPRSPGARHNASHMTLASRLLNSRTVWRTAVNAPQSLRRQVMVTALVSERRLYLRYYGSVLSQQGSASAGVTIIAWGHIWRESHGFSQCFQRGTGWICHAGSSFCHRLFLR